MPGMDLMSRTVIVAGAPGALCEDVVACLNGVGAVTVRLQWDGETGPEVEGLKKEARVAEGLNRAMSLVARVRNQPFAAASVALATPSAEERARLAGNSIEGGDVRVPDQADAVVFVGRDLDEGEEVAAFIEESIAGFHFCLKLGKRLRTVSATDVLAVASATATEEQAALAADIRNGALRQMCLVGASEGGPLAPPMLANALFVVGEPGFGASSSLSAVLACLLRRPQGYVTGTTLTVAL